MTAVALALLGGACARQSSEASASESRTPRDPGDGTALRAELDAAQARICELEASLKSATSERIAREEEWLRYTKALSQLSQAAEKPLASFQPMPEAQAAAAEAVRPKVPEGPLETPSKASAQRDREIFLSLRSLFTVEQVTGYDLLESGALAEGATGPVVLRALDERGRPVGTLAAERLRLEGSRAARTLTLVLENGYERRGGEKLFFEGVSAADAKGTIKRLELPDIDPAPWIESLPELFREEDKAPPADDGLWDLGAVRAALNLLLRQDVSGGWWRLASFGGVQGSVLRDVQLDRLDAEGRLERKLFADRMEIDAQEKGVKIELQDGAQLRGDTKTPFLEGRFRIFLPRASVDEWRRAGVPGLSPPQKAR